MRWRVARVDDYTNALALALEELRARNLHQVSLASGTRVQDINQKLCLIVPFIEREVHITMPDGEFISHPDGEVPVQEKVLIIHYLNNAKGNRPKCDWVTFREVPAGEFYYSAFVKRAIDPLKRAFAENVDVLKRVAPLLKGEQVSEADIAFSFLPLPFVPLKVLLWKGDEEFPSEATILFDRTVSEFFSAEDIAWLSGMVVYRLIGLSKKM
jgi:hypothetical protein